MRVNATSLSFINTRALAVLLCLCVVIAIGLATPLLASHSRLLLLALGGLVASGVLVSAGMISRETAFAFMAIAIVLLPANALRPLQWLTWSDVALVAAGLVVLGAGPRTFGNVRPVIPVLLGALLILLGGLLGAINGPRFEQSITNLLKLGVASWILIAFFAIWQPTRRELRLLVELLIIAASVFALLALVFLERTHTGRVQGLTTHANTFAITGVIVTGPTLMLLGATSGWKRISLLACLGILAIAVLSSGSRAGLLGYCSVLAAFAIWGGYYRILITVLLSAVLFGVLVWVGLMPVPAAIERSLDNETTAGTRSLQYQEVLDKSTVNLALGTGFQPLELETGEAQPVHSVFLQLLDSGGLISVVGFTVIIWLTFRHVYTARKDQSLESKILIGLCLGFLGYLVAGAFQPMLWQRQVWITISLIVVLASRLAEGPSMNNEKVKPVPEVVRR